MKYDPFRNRHKFQDDVWGQIRLNDLERDVIDTPEFQRLFRTSQLGFVELVYHTANHTRGAHSIGACHMANILIKRLNENTEDLHEKFEARCPGLYANFTISPAERILIRLGALLHDISHVPLSHDLEKKSHKVPYLGSEPLKIRSWYGHYDKHDDYERNPVLYKMVFDTQRSVLANVLRFYSVAFCARLKEDAQHSRSHEHLSEFVSLLKGGDEILSSEEVLPQLLFHLLFYETAEEAKVAIRSLVTEFGASQPLSKWHLGPRSLPGEDAERWHNCWYQPYRHDIIGNTLSADLIDYLTRDPQRLGTQRRVDLHLLSYYALVQHKAETGHRRYRCAIDLQDHKRGATRMFLVNDVFRLLDLRQDIHEKAVVHRVVQAANAMLSRGLLLLGNEDIPGPDLRPSLVEVIGFDEGQTHALQSEDTLFMRLLSACAYEPETPVELSRRLSAARRIFQRITERRIYRPLVIISGDWAREKHLLPAINNVEERDGPLRTLAAIVDSAYYSPYLLFACSCVEKHLLGVFGDGEQLCKYADRLVALDDTDPMIVQAQHLVPSRVITWTIPYKQLYKDPAVVVALSSKVDQIDKLHEADAIPDRAARNRIATAIGGADSKYEMLWQLYVFISDGLYYSGILNKLLVQLSKMQDAPIPTNHKERLGDAQSLLSLAFKVICDNWTGLDSQHADITAKAQVLNQRMNATAFKALVRSWVAKYRDRQGWPGHGWSTVDVGHYYHEYVHDESVDDALKRPCRDSRYKFDKAVSEMWLASITSQDDVQKCAGFLASCGIRDLTLFSEGEFRELAELYGDPEARRGCDMALEEATDDPKTKMEAVKHLWLAGFPWIPEPKAERTSTEVAKIPQTQEEIRAWVIQEAGILRPNVRRRLTEELEPIVEVVVTAMRQNGRAVFDDLRARFREESTLIWNDVRCDRIASALKRKWKVEH